MQGTFDRENPINTDYALADKFYQAGYELALELGILCLDTERIINISEDELREALRNTPTELVFGKGRDAVVARHRSPEDAYPPLFISPMGLLVSEEMWVTLSQAVLQHREIDMLHGCSITTIFGQAPLANTPYETLLGKYRAQLTREALWRAGRPGTGVAVISGSGAPFGQMGSYGIPGGFDPETDTPHILAEGEMAVAYSTLHKVIHAINCGGKISTGQILLIGGSAGSPEGVAVAGVAGALLLLVVNQAHVVQFGVTDARYGGTCGREGQWTQSVQGQALSRNTNLIIEQTISQKAGPATEMLLYESAVGMVQVASSGISMYVGPRTSAVKHVDHISPLECKFCGEVLKASAGMTPEQANEIARTLTPKFEGMLFDPPIGERFQDCYDLKTLKPTQEWLDLYLRVKKELINLGVPLAYP